MVVVAVPQREADHREIRQVEAATSAVIWIYCIEKCPFSI
jgi:hypothetical protein